MSWHDTWSPGELQVTMVDNLKGVMGNFKEVITGIGTRPTSNRLFQVKPEDEQILIYD